MLLLNLTLCQQLLATLISLIFFLTKNKLAYLCFQEQKSLFHHPLIMKTVDFIGIQSQIVSIQGDYSDLQTTTTAYPASLCLQVNYAHIYPQRLPTQVSLHCIIELFKLSGPADSMDVSVVQTFSHYIKLNNCISEICLFHYAYL